MVSEAKKKCMLGGSGSGHDSWPASPGLMALAPRWDPPPMPSFQVARYCLPGPCSSPASSALSCCCLWDGARDRATGSSVGEGPHLRQPRGQGPAWLLRDGLHGSQRREPATRTPPPPTADPHEESRTPLVQGAGLGSLISYRPNPGMAPPGRVTMSKTSSSPSVSFLV